jgi:hypothetical protein
MTGQGPIDPKECPTEGAKAFGGKDAGEVAVGDAEPSDGVLSFVASDVAQPPSAAARHARAITSLRFIVCPLSLDGSLTRLGRHQGANLSRTLRLKMAMRSIWLHPKRLPSGADARGGRCPRLPRLSCLDLAC